VITNTYECPPLFFAEPIGDLLLDPLQAQALNFEVFSSPTRPILSEHCLHPSPTQWRTLFCHEYVSYGRVPRVFLQVTNKPPSLSCRSFLFFIAVQLNVSLG